MRKCLKISLSILILIFSLSLIPSNSVAETDHLVINEVYYDVAKNRGTEPNNEWIELYNPMSQAIDLQNWKIVGPSGTERKIASSNLVAPFGFVLISEASSTWTFWSLSSLVPKITLGGPITSYGLSNDGDAIILKNPSGVVVDQISYGSDKSISDLPDVNEGHSLERAPKGGNEFIDQSTPTPGIGLPSKTILSIGAVAEQSIEVSWTQNQDLDFEKYLICVSDVDCLLPFASITDQTITTATIDGLTSGTQYEIKIRVKNSSSGFWDSNVVSALTKKVYSSKILVNELFPHPSTGTDNEFIELYNNSNEDVDLSGWLLDDIEGGSSPYLIPAGATIKANSYLIFYKKETHLALNDDGDLVRLFWPDNVLTSTSEPYKNADYDISWSRNLDNSWLFSTTPTPGAANIFTTKQDEIINIPVIPVEEAKVKPKNEWVKVEGVVTAPPGLFGKRVMYIQDVSGGIKIYFDKALWPELKIGDRVIIYGKISISAGEYQIKVYSSDDIFVVGHDPPPAPKRLVIIELSGFVGQLIRTSGRVIKISGSTIWIDDGSGELRVYFYPATGIKKLGLKEGDWVMIVGILSKTKMGFRLLPRSKSDIKIYKKMTAAKNEPSVVSQVLGVEKAQAAGADYRNFEESKVAGSKKELNPLGVLLVLFGFASLVSLNIFAKIREKYENHN